MANISLSDAEKIYILHGVADDFRCDGRSRSDYRPMELETGVVSNASGSARLRLANTDVLVGVKTEIDKPSTLYPNRGKIEFYVDCSANATPQFEGRGGETLARELSNTLMSAYTAPNAFDLKSLCILPKSQCWKLYVDILILECGGNLFDAVSLAAKAALFNTKIPKVTAAILDAGEADLTISDDPHNCTRVDIESIPILITLSKIGDFCVVDASAEEERCSTAGIVVAISRRKNQSFLTHTHTIGYGTLQLNTLNECMDLGIAVGEQLNGTLVKSLTLEESRLKTTRRHENIGFLG